MKRTLRGFTFKPTEISKMVSEIAAKNKKEEWDEIVRLANEFMFNGKVLSKDDVERAEIGLGDEIVKVMEEAGYDFWTKEMDDELKEEMKETITKEVNKFSDGFEKHKDVLIQLCVELESLPAKTKDGIHSFLLLKEPCQLNVEQYLIPLLEFRNYPFAK